jgi:hypothetical protein
LVVDYEFESMTASPYVGGVIVGQEHPEAGEAIRRIGTNGIPTLLRLLRAKDSALKTKVMGLLARQHIIKVEYQPDHVWNSAASLGFQALGTNAASAVPALIQIASQNISRDSQRAAFLALRWVGPAAKQAVPYLLQWATDTNLVERTLAKDALGHIDPEALEHAY